MLLPTVELAFPTEPLHVTAPSVSLHPITMLYTPELNLGHTSSDGKKLTGMITFTWKDGIRIIVWIVVDSFTGMDGIADQKSAFHNEAVS